MTKELTPGEKLDNILQNLASSYTRTQDDQYRYEYVKKAKQSLADFIEGEMKRVIGKTPKGHANDEDCCNECDLRFEQQQRLKKFVEELRS